jgi:hypothetical protein
VKKNVVLKCGEIEETITELYRMHRADIWYGKLRGQSAVIKITFKYIAVNYGTDVVSATKDIIAGGGWRWANTEMLTALTLADIEKITGLRLAKKSVERYK